MSGPTIAWIQARVAAYYGVDEREMRSASRARAAVRPRQVAMYMACRLTPFSKAVVGRHFGGRERSTVWHAVRNIERLLLSNRDVAVDIAGLGASLPGLSAFQARMLAPSPEAARTLRTETAAEIARPEDVLGGIDFYMASITRKLGLPPGVKARRDCLKCGIRFTSTGPGNRACEPCKRQNASCPPQLEGTDA